MSSYVFQIYASDPAVLQDSMRLPPSLAECCGNVHKLRNPEMPALPRNATRSAPPRFSCLATVKRPNKWSENHTLLEICMQLRAKTAAACGVRSPECFAQHDTRLHFENHQNLVTARSTYNK